MILKDYNWTAACGLEYTVRPVCTLVHKQSEVIKQYWNAFINCFTVVKSCFRAASQSQQFLLIKSMSIKKRKCPLNNRSHIKKLTSYEALTLERTIFFTTFVHHGGQSSSSFYPFIKIVKQVNSVFLWNSAIWNSFSPQFYTW